VLLFSVSSQSTVGLLSIKVPKYLCIYYGYPSAVQNSNGNVTAATNWFKQFDLMVFGGALANTSHPDYAKTVNITQTLVSTGKRVFGYVDMGVNNGGNNYSYAQMQQSVNIWLQMGATVRILFIFAYAIEDDKNMGYASNFSREYSGTMLDLIMV
jgi:hypothetical protein